MLLPALPTMITNSKDKYEATLDYGVRRTLETDGLLSFDDFHSEPDDTARYHRALSDDG